MFTMAMNSSLLFILLLSLLPKTSSQKLPSGDESHFHFRISPAEIFHDTKHLPDGAEVTAYLFKDIVKKWATRMPHGLRTYLQEDQRVCYISI